MLLGKPTFQEALEWGGAGDEKEGDNECVKKKKSWQYEKKKMRCADGTNFYDDYDADDLLFLFLFFFFLYSSFFFNFLLLALMPLMPPK